MTTPRTVIRTATAADYPAVRELTLAVYGGEGYASPSYLPQLADVEARARAALLLVADQDGAVVGSTALALGGSPYAERAAPDEAVFRMLAVAPAARGTGAGAALVRACVDSAAAAGAAAIVISSQTSMTAAHRLYRRLGFLRCPDRDWSPPGEDDLRLWAFRLPLQPALVEPAEQSPAQLRLVARQGPAAGAPVRPVPAGGPVLVTGTERRVVGVLSAAPQDGAGRRWRVTELVLTDPVDAPAVTGQLLATATSWVQERDATLDASAATTACGATAPGVPATP